MDSTSSTVASSAVQLQALIRLASMADQLVSDEPRVASAIVRELEVLDGLRTSVWLRDERYRPVCFAAGHDPDTLTAIQAALEARLCTPGGDTSLLTGGQRTVLPGETVLLLPLRTRQRLRGVLAASRTDRELTLADTELVFVRAVADIASIALGHAKMVRDTAAALEDSRRYGEVLDSISDAVVTCDAEGRIVSWNAAAEEIYGYTRGEALGCDHAALLGTQAYSDSAEQVSLRAVIEQVTETSHWRGELRQRGGDARPLRMLSSITIRLDEYGRFDGFVAVNRDVTGEHRNAAQAGQDPVTGLPNRLWLTAELHDALARSARTIRPLGVLVLAISGVGAAGEPDDRTLDGAMLGLSERLPGLLRATDRMCRISGNELAIITEHLGSRCDLAILARRLAGALIEPFDIGGAPITVRASVGTAFTDGLHNADLTPQRLLAAAHTH